MLVSGEHKAKTLQNAFEGPPSGDVPRIFPSVPRKRGGAFRRGRRLNDDHKHTLKQRFRQVDVWITSHPVDVI